MYSGNLESSIGFLGRSVDDALPVQALRMMSVFRRDNCNFLNEVTVPEDDLFWNIFRLFLGALAIAESARSLPDSTLKICWPISADKYQHQMIDEM